LTTLSSLSLVTHTTGVTHLKVLDFYIKHVMCDISFQDFSVWCFEVLAAFW